MAADEKTLATLALVFAPLSLVSIGGGPSIIAEIQHQAVVVHGWVTQREFADLFAIARAAPGPGSTLLAILIGFSAAGWMGVLVVFLAFFVPSSTSSDARASTISMRLSGICRHSRVRPSVKFLCSWTNVTARRAASYTAS